MVPTVEPVDAASIPLAIEVAAALVRALSLDEMLTNLQLVDDSLVGAAAYSSSALRQGAHRNQRPRYTLGAGS